MTSFVQLSFGESEKSPRVRVLLDFQEKRGFNSSFQDFPFHQNLLSEKNFSKYRNSNLSLISQTKRILSITSTLFLSSNSMRHTFSPRIEKTHFHLNLMKYISKLNEICFFMILHENLIIWSHVHFFSFWSIFHRSHIILVVQPVCQVCEFKHLLNFESHENRKLRR